MAQTEFFTIFNEAKFIGNVILPCDKRATFDTNVFSRTEGQYFPSHGILYLEQSVEHSLGLPEDVRTEFRRESFHYKSAHVLPVNEAARFCISKAEEHQDFLKNYLEELNHPNTTKSTENKLASYRSNAR